MKNKIRKKQTGNSALINVNRIGSKERTFHKVK